MAWTSMHFAVGMACGGAAATTVCLLSRRGWRWVPAAMTAGGVWAILPDLPRLFREDLTGSPLAAWLGARSVERWMHAHGDVFFFHARLDANPHEWALHGLLLILLFYNVGIALLMHMGRRRRRQVVHQPLHGPGRRERAGDEPGGDRTGDVKPRHRGRPRITSRPSSR